MEGEPDETDAEEESSTHSPLPTMQQTQYSPISIHFPTVGPENRPGHQNQTTVQPYNTGVSGNGEISSLESEQRHSSVSNGLLSQVSLHEEHNRSPENLRWYGPL